MSAPQSVITRLFIGLAALAVVVLSATLIAALSPGLRTFVIPATRPAYVPGDTFEVRVLEAVGGAPNLVLMSGPSCAAAARSEEFFSQLVSEANAAGIATWLLSPETQIEVSKAYSSSLGIDEHNIVNWNEESTRLQLMPAIALLDRQATVLGFWQNIHDTSVRQAILDSVREVSTRR